MRLKVDERVKRDGRVNKESLISQFPIVGGSEKPGYLLTRSCLFLATKYLFSIHLI